MLWVVALDSPDAEEPLVLLVEDAEHGGLGAGGQFDAPAHVDQGAFASVNVPPPGSERSLLSVNSSSG